jgi:hypothetical protein
MTCTTSSFTVTCPIAPTTITSYCQTFTIETPCVTVLTCTHAVIDISVVVLVTSCVTVPTQVSIAGETFTITTTGMCTLSHTTCAIVPTTVKISTAPPINLPTATAESPIPFPSIRFTARGSRIRTNQYSVGGILAICFLVLV